MTHVKFHRFLSITTILDAHKFCNDHFGPCKRKNNKWIGGRWNAYWIHNVVAQDNYYFVFTHSEDALLFSLKYL